MKFSILLALLTSSLASGAVVTLYDVVATDSHPDPFDIQVDGTTAYSAIHPSDGSDVTTYEVEDIRTRIIAIKSGATTTSTYTLLATPTTVKYTRIEGKSQLHIKISQGPSTPTAFPSIDFSFPDTTSDCQLDVNKQQGTCVYEEGVPELREQITTISGSPTTITQLQTITHTGTFTGTLVPFTTVTTGGALQRSTNTFLLGSLVATFLYLVFYLL